MCDAEPAAGAPAPPRRLDRASLLLILIGVAVRGVVAWLPFHSWQVDRGPLIDDSFYYFGIARNLAAGLGPTFDGQVMTSGFQPLWAALLVPLWWVVPADDQILPIHLAMSLLALVHGATAVALWRLAAGLGGRWAAWVALSLWTFSPYAVEQGMNGMETGLTACVTLWILERYLVVTRHRTDARCAVRWGLLAGVAWLVRVDTAVLVACLSLDHMVRWGRRGVVMTTLAAVVCVVLVAPWMAWCLLHGGSPLPESGAAVRVLSELFSERRAFSEFAYGTPSFYLDNLARLVGAVLAQPVAPAPQLAFFLFSVLDEGPARPIALVVSSLTYLGLIGLALRSGLLQRVRLPRAVWLWLGATLLSYAFLVPGQWFFSRYVFSIFAVACLVCGVVVESLRRRMSGRWFAVWMSATIASTLVAFSVQTAAAFFRSDGKNIHRHLRLVKAMGPLSVERRPVGVVQAGTIGYFSQVPFAAVDGKVNRFAREAIRERRFQSFLQDQGILAVVDPFPRFVDLLARDGSVRDRVTPYSVEILEEQGTQLGAALVLRAPAAGR